MYKAAENKNNVYLCNNSITNNFLRTPGFSVVYLYIHKMATGNFISVLSQRYEKQPWTWHKQSFSTPKRMIFWRKLCTRKPSFLVLKKIACVKSMAVFQPQKGWFSGESFVPEAYNILYVKSWMDEIHHHWRQYLFNSSKIELASDSAQ